MSANESIQLEDVWPSSREVSARERLWHLVEIRDSSLVLWNLLAFSPFDARERFVSGDVQGFDKRGFVWYTNFESRKSQEMSHNPYGALSFWWSEVQRAVRIEGVVCKVR